MMAIDLTKPIEAAHPDGYVVPMELAHGGSGRLFYTTTSPEPYHTSVAWKADGTNCFPGSSWTIRNVVEATAEPEAAEPLCDHCDMDKAHAQAAISRTHCDPPFAFQRHSFTGNHPVDHARFDEMAAFLAEEQPADPADWTIEEALKQSEWVGETVEHVRQRCRNGYVAYKAILALARMIQRYQPELEPKPPVDPDVLAVREVLARGYCNSAYLSGDWDETPDFLAAVEAFKRVKGGVL